MYHRTGALQGQCRGFSFVTYHTKQEAQHAIDVLNGKQVLSRRISARWAHEQPVLPTKQTPTNINLSTNLATTASNITSPNSRNSMINSIEKKLLTMQNSDSAETTSTLHPALQKAKLNMGRRSCRAR
uniref:RRM domain-containing protein n=1 Tax=Ciona savignyi TaxID=51511 RepID=H2Y5X7_CIOSA